MRLINCRTLSLEEYIEGIPPYAVLSHTWSDGEVSLQDLSNLSTTAELPGYRKITQTCSRALQQGIEYAWIDTCCIDKTSSAELSEAINSMFAWYRNAIVCYAWLSDYSPDEDFDITSAEMILSFEARETVAEQTKACSDGERVSVSEFEMKNGISELEMRKKINEVEVRSRINKGLKQCRWFSRGWTLQELVAPSKVEFLDTNWEFFGSKAELAPILSYITGIDTAVLRGGSLNDVLVGRRMSWAANRQTRRVEDMAYCLLGLFDINMPLLYGEGQKAFTRLQEEIIRSSNDLSIFAWTAPLGDKRQFRSLWASSPLEFISCQWLVKPALEWNGRGEYSITSRGLRTTDMIRIVRNMSTRAGSYFLPLDCVDARRTKDMRFVSLEQYGPSLFARRKPWLYDTVVDIDVSLAFRLPQPQYIHSRESHDLDNMVMTSRVGSVQIDFELEAFDEETITVHPETDWDLRNSILLSYRRRHFWGCWKVQAVGDEDGVALVCAQSDGWLLYGLFNWADLPATLEQSDILPSKVGDVLQKYPNRTSLISPRWTHTVELSEHFLGEEKDKIRCTLLRIRSQDRLQNDTKMRSRIGRLFKKRTWP
ncbi:HET-domain-containing protein [Xylariaceae sp. FL1019]|nr:HET-domain-containing protein [Xylariaceae sp. FL1019]